MSKNIRFVSLDLLRGIAALAIVVFHAMHRLAPVLDPLSICVDLFFVLSGFVLAPIFPNQKVAVKAFMLKRALRFWPMAVTALLVKLVLVLQQTLAGNALSDQINAVSFIGALLLLQIIYEPSLTWIVPLWSLSAEWFSNLIAVPILLRKSRSLEFSMVFIGLILIGLGIYLNAGTNNDVASHFGLQALGRALAGLFIGILLRKNLEKLSKVKLFNNLIVAGGAFFALYVLTYIFKTSASFLAALFVSPLIVAIALKNDEVINSKFNRFAKQSGNLSFGIYVWHVVIINIIARTLLILGLDTKSSLQNASLLLVLTIPITILATLATQRFVEKPVHRYFAGRGQNKVASASH